MLLFNTGIHGVCICFTYVFTISKCSPAEISTVGARRGSRKGFFCAQMTWEIYFQLDSCGLLEKVRRLWDQIKPYKTILCIYIYTSDEFHTIYIPGFLSSGIYTWFLSSGTIYTCQWQWFLCYLPTCQHGVCPKPLQLSSCNCLGICTAISLKDSCGLFKCSVTWLSENKNRMIDLLVQPHLTLTHRPPKQ